MEVKLVKHGAGAGPDEIDLTPHSGKKILVGSKSEECTIEIHGDRFVSRQHCSLDVSGSQLVVEDLSQHGTLVNMNPITGTTVLQDGDRLSIGLTSYDVVYG